MKKFLVLFLSLFAASGLSAQLTQAPANLKPDYADEPAVFLVDERKIEFRDNKDDNLVMIKTLHRIIQVNDDRGIVSFNKLYLPGGADNKIVSLSARTVLKNGKVIEVDNTSLKDYTDEDGTEYKIFAFPGIEKGCTLEYTYTYERNPSLFGIEVFQSAIPVVKSKFELVSPPRLIFEARAFNGNPVSADTSTRGEQRIVAITSPELPEIEDEKYSHSSARKYRVEYKLSYNSSKSSSIRMFTWNELAKRIYANYSEVSDKDRKKVEGWVKDQKFSSSLTKVQLIAAVENQLKKSIMVQKDLYTDAGQNVEQILKSKIAGTTGIMRLYGAIFDKLDIPYYFVLSGDRTGYTIDKSFENWNSADNALIFFPGSGKYIAPTRAEYRYPWIAPEWGQTLALHCKTTSLGAVKTAMADLRPVNLEDFTQSGHNMESSIRIFPESDSLVMDVKQLFTGYFSALYRAAFNFAPVEDQQKFIKEMVKFGTNSEEVLESKVENREFDHFTDNKPIIVSARVKANQLMERAGKKILLKVGEVIGQQVEMYQEKPRMLPVEIPYPHILYRTITIEIPKGYAVKNPESLKVHQAYPEAGQSTMSFISDYTINDNKIVIDIREEYRQTEWAVDLFEPFRKIINAAADFNKVVLVLEKKQ